MVKPPVSNDPVPFAEWRTWYSLARWQKAPEVPID
jgi:hypothetical protein